VTWHQSRRISYICRARESLWKNDALCQAIYLVEIKGLIIVAKRKLDNTSVSGNRWLAQARKYARLRLDRLLILQHELEGQLEHISTIENEAV
jgi:hypothetical protein